MKIYDLIIIGGSAAGASAGIYAARRGLDFKILSQNIGGEVALSGEINNWPGIISIAGSALVVKFKEHLDFYKAPVEEGIEIEKIEKLENDNFKIFVDSIGRDSYLAKSVIVATGVHPRELKIPGEKEFRGKGVSYCTVCDGPLFSGMNTAVIGSGNAGLESVLMLAEICPKVYLLDIAPRFQGEQILIDKLKSKKNITPIFNAIITEFAGKGFVSELKYTQGDKEFSLDVNGVFIHIGSVPNSKVFPDNVRRNRLGEIVVNKNCETNIPGLFAAGDVTDVPFKQIVIAAGQGAIAALSAVEYINKF